MKRLHNLLLLVALTGCNKAHQMGILPVGGSVQERISSSNEPAIVTKQMFFTASGGDLVSFTQEDGVWVATVDKKLPPGFSSKVKLPVHCAAGFSVEGLAGYSPEGQKNLIHIERTSGGQAIVYVGKIGLMGGGAVQSGEREGHSAYRVSCGVLGFVEEYHKCLQCGYRRVGDTNTVANSLISHYCNNCEKCLVKYKCLYSCTRICKECCGCSERIAAEKERARKRREEEARESAERRRREEEARNRSYDSYSSYWYSPSTSYQDREAERKRKEEEARKQRSASARSSLLSSAMGITSTVNADTSTSTNTIHTSTVNRKW